MRCLVKADISSEKWNNSNSGHQEWVTLDKINQEGELICHFHSYAWCDHGEQESERNIEKHFRKDEQGLYQLCQ